MPHTCRFILPLSECEFVINAAVEELQRDAFPAVPEHRPSRCTGTALQVGPLAGIEWVAAHMLGRLRNLRMSCVQTKIRGLAGWRGPIVAVCCISLSLE